MEYENKLFQDKYLLLDDAIEWVENDILERNYGNINKEEIIPLSEQLLLSGFSAEEIKNLAEICELKHYNSGDQIIFLAMLLYHFIFYKLVR